MVISLQNTTSTSRHLRVLPPSTPYFSLGLGELRVAAAQMDRKLHMGLLWGDLIPRPNSALRCLLRLCPSSHFPLVLQRLLPTLQ